MTTDSVAPLAADPVLPPPPPRVVALGGELPQRPDQHPGPLLVVLVRLGKWEDQLLVDLAEEERLRERGDRLLLRRSLGGGGDLHQAALGRPPFRASAGRGPGPTYL